MYLHKEVVNDPSYELVNFTLNNINFCGGGDINIDKNRIICDNSFSKMVFNCNETKCDLTIKEK